MVSSLCKGYSDMKFCRRPEVIDGMFLRFLYERLNKIFSGNLWNIWLMEEYAGLTQTRRVVEREKLGILGY